MKKAPAKQPRPRKSPPFEFFLEALTDALGEGEWHTKPMFGAWGVYNGERILVILREKGDFDDGVWVATFPEHHAGLRGDFPGLRSIRIFGPGETAWQNLPADGPEFEALALRLVTLIRKRDPRIGKIPKR